MTFDFVKSVSAAGLDEIGPNYSAGEMITTAVAIVVFVAVLCAVLFIVWWGVMLILSGGKDEKVKPAINSIRYSVIGLIVIVIALFITPKIVEFMGLDGVQEYLAPNRIFASMKNIATNVFWGSSSSVFESDVSPSLDADFTDL
jgi:Type IV secretion system pilin